jgi:hypothetical protein
LDTKELFLHEDNFLKEAFVKFIDLAMRCQPCASAW